MYQFRYDVIIFFLNTNLGGKIPRIPRPVYRIFRRQFSTDGTLIAKITKKNFVEIVCSKLKNTRNGWRIESINR